MAAAYDTYDYPSYWIGREYEHEAEIIAVNSFLRLIPKINCVLDVGAGYGRLIPTFLYRAKKIIVSDPSVKLLKIARKKFTGKNVRFIQSSLENLPNKIRRNSADLIITVRVLHHIKDLNKALSITQRLLKKNGYFILEFANKSHVKATICEFLKGNFTFPLEIFPQDKRSVKNKNKKTLPFVNYHPDQVIEKLKSLGFTIIEVRSVSNVRSPLIKRLIPKEVLLFFEKHTQKILAPLNFGPSIFVLAKNTK
jgi:ubiquinone/menaquinone biosynthesis C-methylase UbiE